MNFLIRHETDGYVKERATNRTAASGDELSEMLGGLTLATKTNPKYTTNAGSKLRVCHRGQAVPIESTLEIKTRTIKRPLAFNEVAPQLWVSQTPKLVRAYHVAGKFSEPKVEDVSMQIQDWETAHQSDLAKLGGLIRWIVSAIKNFGKATLRYHAGEAELVVKKSSNLPKLLPEDLYVKWEVAEAHKEEVEEPHRQAAILD